jgi:hypothetical protein
LSCLRGSKEKIYKLIYKKHRKLGTLESDPDAVFEEIRDRHMKFVETPMERQMRVLGEWDALWKGQKTALQFEALFEEAVTELELAGLAKNERELLLGYLQKVGPQLAADIQKDVRAWKGKTGEEATRRVATWEEAHKVLVELESIKASGRALLPSYSCGATSSASKGKGKGKDRSDAGTASSGGPKKVCWDMRDKGSCSRGNGCPFSHDKGALAEARKAAKAVTATAKAEQNKSAPPAQVDAGWAKGKGKIGKKGERPKGRKEKVRARAKDQSHSMFRGFSFPTSFVQTSRGARNADTARSVASRTTSIGLMGKAT